MGYTSVRKCIQIGIERRNLIHEREWTDETLAIICKRYGTSKRVTISGRIGTKKKE
jgi:hypothetical protein